MARKRKIDKPFDFGFGLMYNEFPKELHEELDVPGIFKRKSNVKVRLKNGKVLEMDASYVVDPDFKVLFESAVVDLEHQSTPVDEDKIIVIGDYNIQQIADERLPTLNVIASHFSQEKSVKEYQRTPTNTTKLMFLDLGSDDNEKRLSTVSDIINYNEEQLTVNDALNLGIIVLFAPRDDACAITRQVVLLYNAIKKKTEKLEFVLYSVITAMIDAYFDDENEFKELMDMINNETAEDIVGKFETEIISHNKIIELKEGLDEANSKLDEANSRVDEANARAVKAEDRAVKAEARAVKAENKAKNTDSENIQLKAKIKELENQLNGK